MPAARRVLLGLLIATTTVFVSCRRRGEPTQKNRATTTAAVDPNRWLPPLASKERSLTLSVSDKTRIELTVPVGVNRPSPLVALVFPQVSGLRQRCEALGQRIASDAFVLCQATKLDDMPVDPGAAMAVEQANVALVSAQLKIALRMARQRFRDYIAPKRLSLVGIGDAADAAASVVREAPDFFERVALVDGGFRPWTAVDSVRFVGAGGKALLIHCARSSCRNDAMRIAATARVSGMPVRLLPEQFPFPESNPSDATAGGPGLAPTELSQELRWLLDADVAPKLLPSPARPTGQSSTEPPNLPAAN